jgi:hypothetical protein
MLGLDRGLTEHPCLVLSQEDQVVRLIREDADHRDPMIPYGPHALVSSGARFTLGLDVVRFAG